ncbi:MAG: hypothetical protein HOK61_11350 [Alphaproteobacteria bacterium]|jgi:hypothetical protein|nr:hypothetical protein [Alphaproteobacteria bacterium]
MQVWKRSLTAGVMCVLVLLVVACTTTVSRPVFDEMAFGHLPALQFKVGRVEVVDEYRSPLIDPNVEHTFPTPPAVAIRRWIADRVQTSGSSDILRITIRDASAVRVELDTNQDLEAWFTTEQSERIDARVDVQFQIIGDDGVAGSYAAAEAARSRTLPEGATLNERDQIHFDLISALINDFNASMEQAVRQYLADYLR